MAKNTKKEFPKSELDLWEYLYESSKHATPLTEADLPHLWYDEDVDLLHALIHIKGINNGWYAHFVDNLLDTHHAFDDDAETIVGFNMWGFSKATGEKIKDAMDYMKIVGHMRLVLADKLTTLLRGARKKRNG